jgi:hypothetical protein
MRVRKALRKIHRWVGMISAVWLLQLATTGLLLQHADDLKLSQNHVNSPTILKWFDYGKRQAAWQTSDEVLYQVDDVISFAGKFISLAEKVVAAVKIKQDWLVVTAQSVYRYNKEGELLLQLDDFDGLPTPIEQVEYTADSLYIAANKKWFAVGSDGLVHAVKSTGASEHIESRSLTHAEQKNLLPQMLANRLSYDKVLHGIHSGIKSSSWLNTFSALALFYLCFSGLYLFFKQAKVKRTL